MASPAPVAPIAEPTLERSERIARGIMLVSEGHSIRDAAERSGAHYTAIWRALQRLDGEWEHRDEKAWRRASSKAEVVTEMVLNRMMAQIDSAPANVLPAWGSFAAKVAGWETLRERESDGGNILAAILDRIGTGGKARMAIELTGGGNDTVTVNSSPLSAPPSPSPLGSNSPALPQSTPERTQTGVIEATSGTVGELPGRVGRTHTPTGDGEGNSE